MTSSEFPGERGEGRGGEGERGDCARLNRASLMLDWNCDKCGHWTVWHLPGPINGVEKLGPVSPCQ